MLKFRFKSIPDYATLAQYTRNSGGSGGGSDDRDNITTTKKAPPTLIFWDIDDTLLGTLPGAGPRRRRMEESSFCSTTTSSGDGDNKSGRDDDDTLVENRRPPPPFLQALAEHLPADAEHLFLSQGTINDVLVPALSSHDQHQQHNMASSGQPLLLDHSIINYFQKAGAFTRLFNDAAEAGGGCAAADDGSTSQPLRSPLIPIRKVASKLPHHQTLERSSNQNEGGGGKEVDEKNEQCASVVLVEHSKQQQQPGSSTPSSEGLCGISLSSATKAVRPAAGSVYLNGNELSKLDVVVSYAEATAAALVGEHINTSAAELCAVKEEERPSRIAARIVLVDNQLPELGLLSPVISEQQQRPAAAVLPHNTVVDMETKRKELAQAFCKPLSQTPTIDPQKALAESGAAACQADDERFLCPAAVQLVRWNEYQFEDKAKPTQSLSPPPPCTCGGRSDGCAPPLPVVEVLLVHYAQRKERFEENRILSVGLASGGSGAPPPSSSLCTHKMLPQELPAPNDHAYFTLLEAINLYHRQVLATCSNPHNTINNSCRRNKKDSTFRFYDFLLSSSVDDDPAILHNSHGHHDLRLLNQYTSPFRIWREALALQHRQATTVMNSLQTIFVEGSAFLEAETPAAAEHEAALRTRQRSAAAALLNTLQYHQAVATTNNPQLNELATALFALAYETPGGAPIPRTLLNDVRSALHVFVRCGGKV